MTIHRDLDHLEEEHYLYKKRGAAVFIESNDRATSAFYSDEKHRIGKDPTATSHAPGREPFYACDYSVFTWWQPADDDSSPCITVALGNVTCYDISSLRIIWYDIGMEVLTEYTPVPSAMLLNTAATVRSGIF